MSASITAAPARTSFGRFSLAIALMALAVVIAAAVALVALNGTKTAAPTTGAAAQYGQSVTNVPFYDHGWSSASTAAGQSVTNVPFYDHGWSIAGTSTTTRPTSARTTTTATTRTRRSTPPRARHGHRLPALRRDLRSVHQRRLPAVRRLVLPRSHPGDRRGRTWRSRHRASVRRPATAQPVTANPPGAPGAQAGNADPDPPERRLLPGGAPGLRLHGARPVIIGSSASACPPRWPCDNPGHAHRRSLDAHRRPLRRAGPATRRLLPQLDRSTSASSWGCSRRSGPPVAASPPIAIWRRPQAARRSRSRPGSGRPTPARSSSSTGNG